MSERQGGMRCFQATIAARFERPGIADEFRLDAKDLWDNGYRQVDSLSDAFPPFGMEPDSTSLDLRKNAAQICDVLVPVLSEQAEDDAISLSTPRTSDNGPKNGGANTSPGINLLGDGFRSTTTKVAWSKKELSEFMFSSLSLKHLRSDDHKQAVELLEDAKQRAQVLENERRAESASRDLQHLVFAAPANLRGPVASASSSRGPSLAEREMWEDYALNGADFDAGDDAEDDDVRLRRLREEASIFGLWNPDKAARQLGLGEDVVAQFIEEDEEENLLDEIIRTAGECRLQRWFGFVQIGKSQPSGAYPSFFNAVASLQFQMHFHLKLVLTQVWKGLNPTASTDKRRIPALRARNGSHIHPK